MKEQYEFLSDNTKKHLEKDKFIKRFFTNYLQKADHRVPLIQSLRRVEQERKTN